MALRKKKSPRDGNLTRPRSLLAQVEQSWVYGLPNVAARTIRAAILQHERGVFTVSGHLYDLMLRDARIAETLDTRALMLFSKPFSIQKGSDSPRAVQLAGDIAKVWKEGISEGVLRELFKQYIMLGFAVAKINWQPGAIWKPQLEIWHPSFIRVYNGRWYAITANAGEQEITFGDGQWILLTDHPRGYMGGAIRQLANAYLQRQMAFISWARLNEKHGMPLLKVKVPASANGEDKDAIQADLSMMIQGGVVQLPQNVDSNGSSYDTEYDETNAQGYKTHNDLIEALNAEITIAILRQNLTTQVSNKGSYAAAEVHLEVLKDVTRQDAQLFRDAFREQLIRPICTNSFDVVEDKDLPNPVYDTDEAPDLSEQLDAASKYLDLVDRLSAQGLEIQDKEETLASLGLAVKGQQVPT